MPLQQRQDCKFMNLPEALKSMSCPRAQRKLAVDTRWFEACDMT